MQNSTELTAACGERQDGANSPEPLERVAVIVRVYSRISDAETLAGLIRERWKRFAYTLFMAHNGDADGFVLPAALRDIVHDVPVARNSGHSSGACDLVAAGFIAAEKVGGFTAYVFIESDFWLLDDRLIAEALYAIRTRGKKLGSTIWVERRRSLAVDFMVADAAFLRATPAFFLWDEHPEQVLSRLVAPAETHLFSTLRPTHAPKLLRGLTRRSPTVCSGQRFRYFPGAPAVTHHIEDLSNVPAEGLRIKKALANSMSGGTLAFPGIGPRYPSWGAVMLLRLARLILRLRGKGAA